ncbi:MAG: hypothetical protein HKO57_13780, partial [Akkermansiaceae bacterium]|nr:hypothetical protein [Akkermansiaceae bacterium]
QLTMLGRIERPLNDGSRLLDKVAIEKHMEEVRGQARTGDPAEVIALGATAYIHEENGNARGAFAAYEQLELFFDKSKKREDHLYNLVRTSSIIGEVLTTEKYGTVFLKDFPNSKYAESVRSMMLTSLFFGGEYDKCIQVASRMIDTLPEPSDQHDICLHVLGGSYYYTGQYDLAKDLLKLHPEQYPESQFKMAALYFEGSNLSRLQYWSAAAKLLDTFLEKYPDPRENIYLSYALYDRANCHYAEDELEPALSKVNRIETEFPGADVMDMTFNLKGNVLQTLNEFDEAEKYYLKALEIAERRDNRIVASEAVYYLVALLGAEKRGREENPRVGDAVPYYDKFWAEYGTDSPYKAQVAVSGVYALSKAGRAEEALERLQGVIAELASITGAPGLEEAINSYTKAYLEIHTPEELKEHYYQFPGIDSENREAQALLRIAIIGVFETILENADKDQEEAVALKANAMIKVLFQDLKNYFKPKELSNYVLVRLGDYLRENTSAPRQALPYYEEVVTREDQSYRFPALFGIADVYGASDNTNENAKAIQSLERIFNDATDKAEKERSLFRIVTILAKSRDWPNVTARAKEYLSTAGFKKFAPQASLLLAESYDKQDMDEDAIAAYTKTWAAYTGYIVVSAPAVKRIIELTWERNRPGSDARKSDRQTAYEFGWNYLDSTSRLVSQMTPEERKLREDLESLVQEYEDDPTVMKMEDVKKLEEQSR